ncbi:tyrosine-type recombinase/integrase [Sphingopyxis sp.]|jgi:integrase|uniref:tyrosine-type recombinase/integrase n=1 Tax=Sphingopyxis sp. TaxID=1908224 RepID=UPI002DE3CDB6|nr:tyrosine-type recombinase/integrase [Sphingopyxis sp.]
MANRPDLAPNRFREIRLFDGRWITVELYGLTRLKSDQTAHRYDFSWRREGVEWHDSAAEVLIGLLSTHSPVYAEQCALHFGFVAQRLNLLPGGPPAVLKLVHFEDYPDHRPISTWAFVQAVLSRLADRSWPGIDHKIASFLRQPEKWEEKGNGQYFALVANDPRRGALTEQELRSAYRALNDAYAKGRISTKDWALASFLMGTGIRPVQIARATKGDIIETTGPEGREFTLLITLAKTREATKETRWRRKCQSQLAEVLQTYLSTKKMKEADPQTRLFFDSSRGVTQRLTAIFKVLETHSDRLGGPIPLFPYRFRYTMGTRAIALGARDEEVARLLTHTSLHCIQYYRAAMPSLQDPIRELIGDEMRVFAQAFKGRLIDSLEDATRRDDDSALITAYEHLNGADLGACGTRAKCHQNAPRSCLTCDRFEPFREAPWEELRAVLIADRDSETAERIKIITQEQIDAIDGIVTERDCMSARMAP